MFVRCFDADGSLIAVLAHSSIQFCFVLLVVRAQRRHAMRYHAFLQRRCVSTTTTKRWKIENVRNDVRAVLTFSANRKISGASATNGVDASNKTSFSASTEWAAARVPVALEMKIRFFTCAGPIEVHRLKSLFASAIGNAEIKSRETGAEWTRCRNVLHQFLDLCCIASNSL